MAYMPTPQSIIDDDNVDVFESAISTSVPFYAAKRAALWNRYRYVGIGSYDRTYWINCLTSKVSLLEKTYNLKMRVWEELRDRIDALQTDIDLSDGSLESDSTSTTKIYDPPEVSASGADATKYLDTQDSNANHFEQKTYSGLESRTVREWADGVEDPFRDWAEEFRDLFYWGL